MRTAVLWRTAAGYDAALAAFTDLAWLGFLLRRLSASSTRCATARRASCPMLSLREYVIYVLFTPAYIAGPIDRAERFAADLRALPAHDRPGRRAFRRGRLAHFHRHVSRNSSSPMGWPRGCR